MHVKAVGDGRPKDPPSNRDYDGGGEGQHYWWDTKQTYHPDLSYRLSCSIYDVIRSDYILRDIKACVIDNCIEVFIGRILL